MKRFFGGMILFLVIWSRLVGIDWGLPYPMHPDERNMSNAIQQLECQVTSNKLQDLKISECFNPEFFAYGQLPLYGSYLIVKTYHLFAFLNLSKTISFDEATIALRLISVISSLLTVFILYRIINDFFIKKMSYFESIVTFLILSFVPYAIQFAHFGTTESLLMMLYCLILYCGLAILSSINERRFLFYSGLLCGISVGVKLSSVVFIFLPAVVILVLLFDRREKGWRETLRYVIRVTAISIVSFAIGYLFSSPHNIISWSEFVSSINYESAVAFGKAEVFYTRQFFASLPYYFQFVRVFPFVIGGFGLITFIVGCFVLPEKQIKWWLIRLAFLVPFLTGGFMFAKWSRFLAVCYPIMSLVIALSVLKCSRFLSSNRQIISNLLITILVFALILPGIAYLSIYINEDVRFKASRWINNNIPDKTTVLSETANVVDIPLALPEELYGTSSKLQEKTLSAISFDLYNVDTNHQLVTELQQNIARLEYVFVPSRRVYANHTCIRPGSKLQSTNFKILTADPIDLFSYKTSRCVSLQEKYPILNAYYSNLFNKSKYQQIAEFTSYPRISLFGRTLLEFPDEMSEETWTVFDHPVIRIYKKV